MTSVSLPHSGVRVLGRAEIFPDGISFDWTNSGVLFRFRGEGAVIRFDLPAFGQQLYVRLKTDGESLRLCVREGQTTASTPPLPPGEHTVECVRITEVLDEIPLILRDITLTGENSALLPPPPLPQRRILFLGDSITCGYGILNRRGEGPYLTSEQDGSLTYAALTAQYFKAQAHYVCISGRGIVRNCEDVKAPLIPEFFELTSVSRKTPWDHRLFVPDAVVVNAGTNDADGENAISPEQLRPGVESFLKRLQEVYPHAFLLWIYGMMNTQMHDMLRETIAAANDAKIRYLAMPSVFDDKKEQGASCHPNLRAHFRFAGILIDELSAFTGWEL